MKSMKSILLPKSVLVFVLFFSLAFVACKKTSEEGSTTGSSGSGQESGNTATADVEFDFTLAALRTQVMSTRFTPNQIFTGTLTATETSGGFSQEYTWSTYLDDSTWEVQSNKTINLPPGDYDFFLDLTKGDQKYLGESLLQTITDGTNDSIDMTIRPVIGDLDSNTVVTARLPEFKFSYDPTELTGLTEPKIGIIIDGEAEEMFPLNPTTGISDLYVSLSEEEHIIKLKLYDGDQQRGKSVLEQETINVVAGENITMDLVPLHGETQFSLIEEGGEVQFNFTIPAEVIDEAGGLENLRVDFKLADSPKNDPDTDVLSLSQSGLDYVATKTLSDMQYDTLDISLEFWDVSKDEQLGVCNQTVTLTKDVQSKTCDLTLRRRAVTGGSILAVLSVNVFNEQMEPVENASIYDQDDNLLGITGSGGFGTPGYLKFYLQKGNYIIKAENSEMTGNVAVDLSPLEIKDIDIILDTLNLPSPTPTPTPVPGPPDSVAQYSFNVDSNRGQDSSTQGENHPATAGSGVTFIEDPYQGEIANLDGSDSSYLNLGSSVDWDGLGPSLFTLSWKMYVENWEQSDVFLTRDNGSWTTNGYIQFTSGNFLGVYTEGNELNIDFHGNNRP